MNGRLKSDKKIRVASSAAGVTTLTGSVIDMQGFEAIEVALLLGTLTATNVTTLKLQQGALANGSDMADITGASVAGDDTMSNKALVVEAIKPTKRYVRYVVTRATANAVVDGLFIRLSGARKEPVTDDSTIAGSAQVVAG